VPDKLTSPAGEEFVLADASVNRVLVKGVVAVMHARTERLWSTKEGDMFLCADAEGNLDAEQATGAGFYWRDTRYLSDFRLEVDGHAPLLLSTSADRAFASHVDLTNQDLLEDDGSVAAVQGTVSIRRTRVVDGRLYERIRIKSYNAAAVTLTVRLTFGTDFADIFEVRGLKRAVRGRLARPKADRRSAVFAYEGEDGVFRETRIAFELDPTRLDVVDDQVVAEWELRLEPTQTELIALTVEPRAATAAAGPERSFDVVMHDLRRSYETWERACTRVWTDNELYNSLLSRGLRDLRALLTPTRHGSLVAAGIPWFVAPFGRDALLTCHQTLMVNPDLTRTTLEVLAAFQADEVDEWRDAQPGKILHELRQGELAGAGIIPHIPYYGSIDSTPLWLLLLGTYWRWTGDLEFCRRLLPNVERALAWIADYGDPDGDGFVEYQRSSPRGLANQGWKDSHDSVGHVDGKLAEGPIALAEVQAYIYLAKLRLAEVFEAMGDAQRAATLRAEADGLRRAFNEAFWVESEQFYAMALDGDKRQVTAISSNPAHGLYCGIVDPERAGPMARRLLAPDMFSGWGVRTLSKSAAAYNPMSYHNGSIWPHDNAIIGAGLKRYGFAKATNRLATAMFEMAVTVDDMRLPELFCGFTRRSPNRPVAYPVACSPQAWAAGAPFLLLQAMLGISADAPANTINVNRPHLPGWLNTVELHALRVGGSTVSIVFQRRGETTGFSLLDKEGDVRVLMEE
jgi:glycogen debranching enzyme